MLRKLLALSVLVLLLSPATPSLAASSGAVQLVQPKRLTGDEQQMLDLLNSERTKNGKRTLPIDPKLSAMARSYADEMITYGFFDHSSPISGDFRTRIDKAGIKGWTMAGENLVGAASVEYAFQLLMESESHRDNILESRYTHVGIGEAEGSPYGKVIVQEFVALPKSTPTKAKVKTIRLKTTRKR